MLLQCEMASASATEDAGLTAAWLGSETLESLIELNEDCLALLAEQAQVSPGSALLSQVAELWRTLDAAARRRAAGCLYLLLDAGFADPQHWQRPPVQQVDDAGGGAYGPFFTVPAASAVAQVVFTFAWHLARCQSTAARLLLGMPAPCVALVARLTLRQVRGLADAHPEWLKPRWPADVRAWRGLLAAAAADEPAALERARLRGQTLLAAEARTAAATCRRSAPCPVLGAVNGPLPRAEPARPVLR